VVIARRGSPKAAHFRRLGAEVVFNDEVGDYIAKSAPGGLDSTLSLRLVEV